VMLPLLPVALFVLGAILIVVGWLVLGRKV
jgi:hypothetical protein